MRSHLRKNLESLLPLSEPQKKIIILSIGCGSKEECVDADLVAKIFSARGIQNFCYIGVDSDPQKIASNFSGGEKNNFRFYCKDAASLMPSDLKLEANSVSLVILRHPRFELFMSSKKDWEQLSIQEMLDIFTSKSLQEAKRNTGPWILVPSAEDFVNMTTPPVTIALIGVFKKIIEEVIPKFMAENGKLFISCYQMSEIAAAIHFSKSYCEFDGNIRVDDSVAVMYQSRIDRNVRQQHYLDGYQIVLTNKNPALSQQKNKCRCPSIFSRIPIWFGISEEAIEKEPPKIKFL